MVTVYGFGSLILGLSYCCYTDVRFRKISNNNSLLCCFISLFTFITLNAFSYDHLIPAFFSITASVFLWFVRFWGGGDSKLVVALTPIIVLQDALMVWAVMFVSGGILALFVHVTGWLNYQAFRSVPYAIAISVGALYSSTRYLLSY